MIEQSRIQQALKKAFSGTWFFAVAFVVLGALGGFGATYWSISSADQDQSPGQGEVRENSSRFNFINPLLECDLGQQYLAHNQPKPSKNRLNQLIDAAKSQGAISFASVYYRDLNNGPWIGINENEKFVPASLLKVPLMMYYFKKAELDSTLLEKQVVFATQPSDEEVQYFKPSQSIDTTKSYSVRYLIEHMITYSDNAAATALAGVANEDTMKDLFASLHVESLSDKDDFITVKSYSSFFRVLFNSSYLTNESSEAALSLLITG